MLCRLTSSKKTPCPCTSRRSSLRGTFWPTKPGFVSVSSTTSGRSGVTVVSVIRSPPGPTPPGSRARCSLARRRLDRVHDVHVPRAAADVALNRPPDLLLAGTRIALQEPRRAHQHAWRAVAALERVVVGEGLLECV